MTLRTEQPTRRQYAALVISLIVLTVVCICLAYTWYHSDNQVQARDTSKVAMAIHTQWLVSETLLRPVGLVLATPTDVQCNPGDPELYRFDCSSTARISISFPSALPSTVASLQQKVVILDTQLHARGWQTYKGNYELSVGLPSSRDTYTVLDYLLFPTADKVLDCELQANIAMAPPPGDITSADTVGQLTCDITE